MESNEPRLVLNGVDIRDLGAVIHQNDEYFGIEVTNCAQEVKDAIRERMFVALGINTKDVIYDRSGNGRHLRRGVKAEANKGANRLKK